MPTFDSGAYFLTTLIPISTAPIFEESGGSASPAHALRKRLSLLPRGERSPFARSSRNHFARFVVIDDVAYNGREQPNTLLVAAAPALSIDQKYKDMLNPVIAQPQDRLSCPFLFFSADFDAASGADSERDAYLRDLWIRSEAELKEIFKYCLGFEARVTDAASFAKYIADCQIETTMPFHDYWLDGVPADQLPNLSLQKLGLVGLGILAAVAALVYFWLLPAFLQGFLGALIALVAGVAAAGASIYFYVLDFGKKPFPAAPNSTLPEVLKALYLRREFTRFAIDRQFDAAGSDEASAQSLYDSFKSFIDANKPDDVAEPTQKAGAIGI
ncbi:hypothetical protein FM996_03670 [Methylosinus sporium]|uniref:Uncharacterized protein n=1 Tax=Methylosinus sporium TaxID=428 RepID=A0A549T4F9_METSR|nr:MULTISPECIES: hypothetical protein [Methylosinus]MBU3889552.1 hypothetical protein [Methylosinus sp. KRF6]TRL36786.1 hypothetical protein FM996_03670 [Methylosinus sporium]